MKSAAQRVSELRIELDDQHDVHVEKVSLSARPAEQNEPIDALKELYMLESCIDDLEGVVKGFMPSVRPRITGVTLLEMPIVQGEIDAPLAKGEAIHVFDALTGEDLGAAFVNGRWWTIEDTRPLKERQIVTYVARLIDADGRAGELSNAREFLFQDTSQGDDVVALFCNDLQHAAPLAVAVVRNVEIERYGRSVTPSRKRPDDAKMIVGQRRIVSGTLSMELVAGESVHLFDGQVDIGCPVVNGARWTFCDERVLRVGSAVSYTAQVSDRAGRFGLSSSVYMMTVCESAES